MGGRQSRSTLANYGDDHRSHYPPSSLQSLISANPNMQRRPLPEIPRSPAESVSTQLSPVSLSCPEAARTEHVDAASLPRVVFGVEHFYAHQRQRRHHGTTSGLKCPMCFKEMTSSELEQHLIVCLARSRAMYNVDTLNFDAGECTICLDDMATGDKIARLPCLCIYHIRCIEQWHKVKPTCPVHPESESSS